MIINIYAFLFFLLLYWQFRFSNIFIKTSPLNNNNNKLVQVPVPLQVPTSVPNQINPIQSPELSEICEYILNYTKLDKYLPGNLKNMFTDNCHRLIWKYKMSPLSHFNLSLHEDINNFLLQLINIKYNNLLQMGEKIFNPKPGLRHILSKLNVYFLLNPNKVNEKVDALVRYSKFLLDNPKTKNVLNLLVLNNNNDKDINNLKMEIFEKQHKDFLQIHKYLTIKHNYIKLYNIKENTNLFHIKNQSICTNFIHLCSKYYEQINIYLQLKSFFFNLVDYIVNNVKEIEKKEFLDLFIIKHKINSQSDKEKKTYLVHLETVTDITANEKKTNEQNDNSDNNTEDVIYRLIMSDLYIYNTKTLKVNIFNHILNKDVQNSDENKTSLKNKEAAEHILLMKNLKKKFNGTEIYSKIMETLKEYVLKLTEMNKNIKKYILEMAHEDIEKFLIDLVFLITYGFLRIDVRAEEISLNDITLTYNNIYRANQLMFLYFFQITVEQNIKGNNKTYLLYKKLFQEKKKTDDNVYNTFDTINEINHLMEINPKLTQEHFANSLYETPINYETLTTMDKKKIEFFFLVTYKKSNANQIYSETVSKVWMELLYVYDNFGWFYMNPTDVFGSLQEEEFNQHLLISRNFLQKFEEPLMYLDTQVARLIKTIELFFKIDKSKYILDFSLPYDTFVYENDIYNTGKNRKKKILNIYDYIESIANNYFSFSDEKYPIFNFEFNNKLYIFSPNIYSLAYQLFNELSINVNITTNTPLKKQLYTKSSYAFFTILNIMGKNYDTYSRGPRMVFAAYVLALVNFIESYIDISRYKPEELFLLKGLLPIINEPNKNEFKIIEDRCKLLTNFIQINKTDIKNKTKYTNIEEYIKILSLVIIVLWGKESKQYVYYDNNVSLYKKLMIACVFNG
ncbi:high molecular weight rhoptry protein 2, partial [Hepatocystis sp. ex Piliocolobus tephrosceles]